MREVVDLTKLSEEELLEVFHKIIERPGQFTPSDCADLARIEEEFNRRSAA